MRLELSSLRLTVLVLWFAKSVPPAPHIPCELLTRFFQLRLEEISDKLICAICLDVYNIPYRHVHLSQYTSSAVSGDSLIVVSIVAMYTADHVC